MYNLKVKKVILGILLVGLTYIVTVSYTATLPLSYRQHLIARINARHQISPSFKSSIFSVWNELDNENENENETETEAAAQLCQADLTCVPYKSLPLLLNLSLELADKMEGLLLLNEPHDLSLFDLNYLASSGPGSFGSSGPGPFQSHHFGRNPNPTSNQTDPEDELLSQLSQQFSTLIDTYLRKIKQTPELSCLLKSPCFQNLENTAKEIEDVIIINNNGNLKKSNISVSQGKTKTTSGNNLNENFNANQTVVKLQIQPGPGPGPNAKTKPGSAPVSAVEEPKPQSRFLFLTFLYLVRAKHVFKSVLKGVRIIKAMVTLIQVVVTLVGLFG